MTALTPDAIRDRQRLAIVRSTQCRIDAHAFIWSWSSESWAPDRHQRCDCGAFRWDELHNSTDTDKGELR